MGPKAQRSRACNQCRERRVKCDETPDTCQQCARLGLKCSGPLQGSIIINMTDRVTKPRQRKKREARTALVVRDAAAQELPAITAPFDTPPLQTIHYAPQTEISRQRERNNAIATIQRLSKYPTVYQASQAHNLDLAFISHFVELNNSVRPNTAGIPFITHLPALHSKANIPALRLSIRATAMAFYANVHGNASIMVDSYRWYTISLNSQRLALSRMDGQSIPDDEQVIVPIILGLYEVYAGTAPINVFQHLIAAAKIIELRGPHNCSSGVALHLFNAVRVSEARRAMIFNQPSVFSSKEWMTIPFLKQPRNAPQYLNDFLFSIPPCIHLCGVSGSLSDFFNSPVPLHADLRSAQERTKELLRDLSDWAALHPHFTAPCRTPLVATPDMSTIITDPVPPAQDESGSEAMVDLPITFVNMVASTYWAIRLVLTLILEKVLLQGFQDPSASAYSYSSPPPQSPVRQLLDNARSYSRKVLKISAFLESTNPVGFDLVRSVFPLVVVRIAGPGDEERTAAKIMMERWGRCKGLGGLCGSVWGID